MGTHNLGSSKDDDFTVFMTITSIDIHPSYKMTVSYYDVAVLTVKSVPSQKVNQLFYITSVMGRISGWISSHRNWIRLG